MSSTITRRNLDENNDPLWGQGQLNYISDVDAVAQIIRTRLLLFEGEWWADTLDGTPYWQSILGKAAASNIQAINLILTRRILETPYVTGVLEVSSNYDNASHAFTFRITVQTQFGAVSVTNLPQTNSQALPI